MEKVIENLIINGETSDLTGLPACSDYDFIRKYIRVAHRRFSGDMKNIKLCVIELAENIRKNYLI